MAYIFIIAPIALQIAFLLHAIRHGRVFPWMFVIMFLPLLGCLAYFIMEMMPDLRNSRQGRALAVNVRDIAQPGRALNQAHREVSLVGSIDARRNLADEYMRRGQYHEAVVIYQEALQGHFSDDVALLQGLARARFMTGDGAGAQSTLDTLQKVDPSFVSADMHLLYARSLELQGKDDEALTEYSSLVRYFSGEEARARYGLLLKRQGRHAEARALFDEILRLMDGAPKHYVRAQREWRDIARQNLV